MVDMETSEKSWNDAECVKGDVSKNPLSGQLKAVRFLASFFILLPRQQKYLSVTGV
jgi:hypothetical protein